MTLCCKLIFNKKHWITQKCFLLYTDIQQANPLEPRKIYSGVEAEMECIPPLGKPTPKPLWLKDGKTFSDPRVDQSTFTLKISKTQLSDTANYTCVSMGYKNRTTTASLTVYESKKMI